MLDEAAREDDVEAPPAPFARPRRFKRGALLFAAGTPAKTIYLLRAGQARTYLLSEAGDETTTAALGPGQILGISPFLGRAQHYNFAQALSPLEVWALETDLLLARLPDDARLARSVVQALLRRLAMTQALLRDVALLPVAERIPDVLPRIGTGIDGQPTRLTRELLGSLIGARRETVSRALAGASPS